MGMTPDDRVEFVAERVRDFMVDNTLTSVRALYENGEGRHVIEGTNDEHGANVEVRKVEL